MPRRLMRYAISSAEDISVDESLDKNSQEGKCDVLNRIIVYSVGLSTN